MSRQVEADLPVARRVHPVRKLSAVASDVLIATGESFETHSVDALPLGFEGIPGDRHAGITRNSGSREPWYKRNTEMRNERQVTLVSGTELVRIAAAMELPGIEPGWIGANLVLDGVPDLSMLPSGTLIFFAGGATLKVDGQNKPCRDAGRLVAERAGMADRLAGELLFPKAANRLRGLVAWVERPGEIRPGEAASLRLPEQWIY